MDSLYGCRPVASSCPRPRLIATPGPSYVAHVTYGPPAGRLLPPVSHGTSRLRAAAAARFSILGRLGLSHASTFSRVYANCADDRQDPCLPVAFSVLGMFQINLQASVLSLQFCTHKRPHELPRVEQSRSIKKTQRKPPMLVLRQANQSQSRSTDNHKSEPLLETGICTQNQPERNARSHTGVHIRPCTGAARARQTHGEEKG
jgi:hypothetical protein